MVATSGSKEISFTNLDYYTNYVVVVTYCYDLNDGDGIHTESVRKDYKTSPHLELESCEIVNTTVVDLGETIFMQFSLNNPQRATPTSVIINGTEYTCTVLSGSQKAVVKVTNNGQFGGGDIFLTIERINMELDGKSYSIIPSENNKASIFVNGRFSASSVSFVNAEHKPVDWCFFSEKIYGLLTVEGRAGYTVTSISVSGSYSAEITELIKIDDSQYLFDMSALPYGYITLNVTSISYENEYVQKTADVSLETHLTKLQDDTIHTISSYEDLMAMKTNGDFLYYELGGDIDLSGHEWTNAGDFTGIFDGNNHTISNMSYNGTYGSSDFHFGLFDAIRYSFVYDLNLVDVTAVVTVEYGYSETYEAMAGSVAAISEWSVIKNCKVGGESTLSIINDSGNAQVGGIIGSNSHQSKVMDCVNESNVTGERFVGGISGANNESTISGCLNRGAVTGDSCVGGISGNIDGLAKDCANTGNVTGKSSVGGIGGDNYHGNITSCENYGAITGGSRVGGATGDNYFGIVVRSNNYGDAAGKTNVGGIAGSNYDYGSSIYSSTNKGNVTGESYVGGITANNYYGYVSACVNEGVVTGNDHVGGIAADNQNGHVTQCNNYGDVTGKTYVGGIVGTNFWGEVNDCINKGDVTGESCVDGIAGDHNYEYVSNCTNEGNVIILS